MNKTIALAAYMLISLAGFSQDHAKMDSLLNVLNDYTTAHVPDMHSGIKAFSHQIEDRTLFRTTSLFEGKPYRESFDLDMATVFIEREEMDNESAKAYGFKYYFEVVIDEVLYLSNIEELEVAERMSEILGEIVDEVNGVNQEE